MGFLYAVLLGRTLLFRLHKTDPRGWNFPQWYPRAEGMIITCPCQENAFFLRVCSYEWGKWRETRMAKKIWWVPISEEHTPMQYFGRCLILLPHFKKTTHTQQIKTREVGDSTGFTAVISLICSSVTWQGSESLFGVFWRVGTFWKYRTKRCAPPDDWW